MKRFTVILILLAMFDCLCQACTSKESTDEQTETILKSLKDNQARILVKIDGKEFYLAQSVFSGQTLFTPDVLNVTLTDQFEGKTILNIAKEKWYATGHVGDDISTDGRTASNLKMGKIIDREKMIGEGYMMTEGKIEAVRFAKNSMIFKLTGKVGKYSDFQQPDKYVPFEGTIIYKKPAVSLVNITENEVFSASTTN
ncbi:hypothetical protein [Dyadobacter luticola]|uniref:LPS export ABC transporter periplasmic protein LptC n=1 Tax=Dyadobacter luticola TaxID=1979387 RepID=A0A5R9KRH4_9BACT|nr:hypothetical protein [Dyadobacter luticola]TLU98872.1 hypothetical protein FEN17_19980 [Dyadobacter luticola]